MQEEDTMLDMFSEKVSLHGNYAYFFDLGIPF